MKRLKHLTLFTFLMVVSSVALAGVPNKIMIQGRLENASGVAVEAASVQVNIRVVSPGVEACVLYSEVHTLGMAGSDGRFSVPLGGGTTDGSDPGKAFVDVFDNTKNLTSLSCATGSSYTPAANDPRKIQIQTNDGGGWQAFPAYVLNSSAFAMQANNASSFGGKAPAAFLQTSVSDNLTQANLVSVFTSSKYTDLVALLDGTSSKYAKVSSGAVRVSPSALPGSPAAGDIAIDSGASNALKWYDGSSWQTVGAAGSGISALTGDITATGPGVAPATIATGAVTSAKMAPTGVTAGTYGSQTQIPQISVDPAGRITSIATMAISDTLAGLACAMNEIPQWNGSMWTCAPAGGGGLPALTNGKLWVGNGSNNATDVYPNGDVTMSSTGAFTVNSINNGGTSASQIVNSITEVMNATPANSGSMIVKRDPSGNFIANSARFTSSMILKDGGAGGEVTFAAPVGFSNYTLTWPSDDGSNGQVLKTDGNGILSWANSPMGNFMADGSIPMNGPLQSYLGTASTPGYTFVGDTDTGMFYATTNTIGFSTVGAERLRIDPGGNVGIGTTTPSQMLEVAGSIKAQKILLTAGGSPGSSCTGYTGAVGYFTGTDSLVVCDNSMIWKTVGGSAPPTSTGSFTSVSFTSSNFVRVTASGACSTMNVTTPGEGHYTATLPSITTSCTTIQWNGSPTNVKMPVGYTSGATTGAVYEFIDDGMNLWVKYQGY